MGAFYWVRYRCTVFGGALAGFASAGLGIGSISAYRPDHEDEGDWFATGLGISLVCLGGSLGCNRAEVQKCHDEMARTQTMMTQMDTNDLQQVSNALAAVKFAKDTCEAAGRMEEAGEVQKAVERLGRQKEGLEERANRKPKKKLTPEEIAQLEKKGDPTCPRGQQYQHPTDKEKMIRCTGKQVIEMNWEELKKEYEASRYTAHVKGTTLRFERGARVHDFEFKTANSKTPASCISIVPDPGISWQEVVARMTGAHPQRLKLGKPVPTKRGSMKLLVEGDLSHVSVKIGDCKPTPGQKPLVEEPKAEN